MKLRSKRTLARSLVLAALAGVATMSSFAADLTVDVSGVQTSEGRVFVGLYEDAAQMKNKQHLKGLQIEAAKRTPDGKVQVTFTNLASRTYAVAAFHDINNDGKLTTNLMGMPSEPYAFSNNAVGSFGPPSFEAASLKMGNDNMQTAISLK
jgi:uncharacterized protein (DUF2141 family)